MTVSRNLHTGSGREELGKSRGEWEVFGRRVAELRSAAGLTHEDLAMREVCGSDEVHRIESGTTVPARCTADYLDRETGARGRLLNFWARAAINTHLATGARPHELDTSAGTIREFQPGTIPAQLQCRDYGDALDKACGRRADRQSGLWNRIGDLRVVVNEAAVRTVVGGREVMREQLRRLISAMRHSGLRLQIVPQGATEHPCPMGPFRLLSLGPAYTVAHVLSPCGDGQLITAPSEVQAFVDLFEDLRGAALPGPESLDLLVRIEDGLRDRKAITTGSGGDPVAGSLIVGGALRAAAN